MSASAAILVGYGGVVFSSYQFAFTLRGDMSWPMAVTYILVQFVAAATGSFVAALMFGYGGNLAATIPYPDHLGCAVIFEEILTFGLILLVLNMANGPKLSGNNIPLPLGLMLCPLGP